MSIKVGYHKPTHVDILNATFDRLRNRPVFTGMPITKVHLVISKFLL